MTRRRALAAIPAAAVTPVVDERIAEFHRHWDKFLRAYLGCPPGAAEVRECDPRRGLFDYPEFIKAAKIGRKLFENV